MSKKTTTTIALGLIMGCLFLAACGQTQTEKDWEKTNQELIEAAENEPIYADVDWDLKDYIDCTIPSGYKLETEDYTGEGTICSENNPDNVVVFMGIDDYKGKYNISQSDCVKHMYHTMEGTGKNDSQTWITEEDVQKWLEEAEKTDNEGITIYRGKDNALLKKGGTVMHVELNGPEFEPYFDDFCKSIRFIK